MPYELASDATIRHLPVPEQLFAYADAYLKAAHVLCERAASNATPRSWPDGAVVLMTGAHALELFLKAAILKRAPEAGVWERGHNIGALIRDFEAVYPEPEFRWDIPFRESAPSDLTAEEAKYFMSWSAPPSILFRYPVNRAGAPWVGLHAFEPHSFLSTLAQLKADFESIRARVA